MLKLLRITRPLHLLLALLTYFLGWGLARYLGNGFRPVSFWLGLLAVLLAQAATFLLSEVFRPVTDPIVEGETAAERKTLQDQMLYLALGGLAAFCVAIFIIYLADGISPLAFFYIFIALVLVLLYAVPPLRLVRRGFGEFVLALQLAYVVPSISFLLQASGYHRLLAMLVFPLTLLALACFLVLDFPTFAQDRKFNRGSMLVYIGWERAVPLHNILVIAAYLILLAAPLFGVSLGLLWPAFLTVPFALLQIFSLRNLALGGKPVWRLFQVTAIAVFGLTADFMTLTFWLK
jgi:1,4-dihydroxy-2-naphthoate octaprenyltransferase